MRLASGTDAVQHLNWQDLLAEFFRGGLFSRDLARLPGMTRRDVSVFHGFLVRPKGRVTKPLPVRS